MSKIIKINQNFYETVYDKLRNRCKESFSVSKLI